MRRTRVWVLVLALVLAANPPVAGTADDDDEGNTGVDETDPITRDGLRDGLSQLVMDEAIAAANSPVFRSARDLWDSVDELVP